MLALYLYLCQSLRQPISIIEILEILLELHKITENYKKIFAFISDIHVGRWFNPLFRSFLKHSLVIKT